MQHAAAFERMMHLYEWQPWHTTEGNPDLFAPRRRVRWWLWAASVVLAAAAAVGLSFIYSWRAPAAPAVTVSPLSASMFRWLAEPVPEDA